MRHPLPRRNPVAGFFVKDGETIREGITAMICIDKSTHTYIG